MGPSASALTQRAREAQKAQRWAEAEALWREALAIQPGDRGAQSGLAGLLLIRGRIDEARALAEALRSAAPNDQAALTLSARIAAEEEDWPVALDAWHRVLATKPDAAVALNGVGAALLGTGDIDGARKWAERLVKAYPRESHGLVLSARVATARGDRDTAIDQLAAATARFAGDRLVKRELCRSLVDAGRFDEADGQTAAVIALDREEGLILRGDMLTRRKPDDDLTDFWKGASGEFPRSSTLMRRYAAAAMKAGRAKEAIDAMRGLLVSGTLWHADAQLIVGLAHMLAAQGDNAALRKFVRTYLKSLKRSSTYRLAALRLSRTIFAHFAGLNAPGKRPYRERTSRMVERAMLQPRLRDLLDRVVTLESTLASRTTALFDTDVSREECRAFVAHVREHVARRTGYSFVRINDGESNAFPYEPHLAEYFAADAAEREHVWWGRTIPADQRAHMTARVAEAARHADAIGIPNFTRILRDVRLATNEDLSHSRTGRGLRTVLAAFERWSASQPNTAPLFTSANLHQDLQRWNLYRELFDGAGDLVLVTCHPDLPDVMREAFGATVAANIVVPPRHFTIPALKKRADTPHILPEIIDDVVAEVCAVAPGRMVVIGAGYLGKWIAHQAKLAGGVALDLGSALDYWMGLRTRSYQDLA